MNKSLDHKIIQKRSPNFDHRFQDSEIRFIIVHHTACDFDFSLEILTSPSYGVSAHYLIDENGAIHQLVPDEYRAWHAGVSAWGSISPLNSWSIGIELVYCPQDDPFKPYPPKQMEAFMELTKVLQNRYQIPAENVLGHSDIAIGRKVDPGPGFDWKQCAQEGIGLNAFQGQYNHPVHHSLSATKEKLHNIGYVFHKEKIQMAIDAFKMHFCPDELGKSITFEFLSHLHHVEYLSQLAYAKRPY